MLVFMNQTKQFQKQFKQADSWLQHGKFGEARELFAHLLAQGHTEFGVYFGLALAALQLQDYPDAIARFQQAVMLNMRHESAHYHLGLAQEYSGANKDALQSYTRAATLKPDWQPPFARACRLHLIAGDKKAALPFAVQMFLISPQEEAVWENYKRVTYLMDAFYEVELKLEPVLKEALKTGLMNGIRAAIIRHQHAAPWMVECNKLASIEHYSDLIIAMRKLIKQDGFLQQFQQSLLLPLMHRDSITQPILELLLTQIRRHLLLECDAAARAPFQPLQWALCSLGFNNEYVFFTEAEEAAALKPLRVKLVASLPKIDNDALTLLGSYTPLAQEDCAPQLAQWQPDDAILKRIIEQQCHNPQDEQKRKLSLPRLDEIDDATSQKVREQYESAPYPRWNEVPDYTPISLPEYVARFGVKPEIISSTLPKQGEVLIAGCGTGQHPIMLAASLCKSALLAVDISLSSLAYAQRKAEQYGCDQLTFMQADILKLLALNRTFDMIESVGVLHHMRDPIAGWKVLTDILKPGGMMRIGLYSQMARRSVTLAREEIKARNLGDSDDALRHYRRELMQRNYEFQRQQTGADNALTPIISDLYAATDFFSLSECRDLIFHVQEHQFTWPQIGKIVSDLGLEFCGINLMHRAELEAFEATLPPPNHPDYLIKWHAYEQQNPDTFKSMYQFWLKKPLS